MSSEPGLWAEAGFRVRGLERESSAMYRETVWDNGEHRGLRIQPRFESHLYHYPAG